MKKLIMMACSVSLAWAYSCSGDSEEELFERPPCSGPVSLSADIMPLLESNCAIEGCHVSGSGLPDFMNKETVLAHADDIAKRTREGSMPPPYSGITLTTEEIEMITCWVDQGKEDN